MRAPLIIVLLFVLCFGLAAYLQPRQAARELERGQSGSALALMLGDGRKMFAKQFFAKADGYFHRGRYPSIFDDKPAHEENHMVGATTSTNATEAAHEDHDDHDEAPPKPHDWIEAFGQRFYPNKHVHLEQGAEREMLPWLKLSTEMDPEQVETYAVAAYWLRDRLGKVDEAEQFLREGLKANPGSPELLYELGRTYFERRHDLPRARNLFAAAVRRWQAVEGAKPEEQRNKFLLEEILGEEYRLELQDNQLAKAREYLEQLKAISPNAEVIQQQIDALDRKIREASTNSPAAH